MRNFDEIKELYIKLKRFIKILYAKKILIIINIILVFCLGYFTKKEKQYEASTSIFLNTPKGSGLMSLATKFGIGGNNGLSYDKLIGLISSADARIFMLKSIVNIDGVNDYMINHYTKIEKIDEKWKEKKPELLDIDFSTNGKIQDSLITALSRKLKRNIIVNQESQGFITIKTKSENEDFAFNLNQLLCEFLKNQIKSSELQTDITSLHYLKIKKDSLDKVINELQYRLAKVFDETKNSIKMQGQIEKMTLENDLFTLNKLRSDLIVNLELTSYNVNSYSFPLTFFDQPRYPLESSKLSLIILIILSLIIGFILSVFIIITQHYYKKFEGK